MTFAQYMKKIVSDRRIRKVREKLREHDKILPKFPKNTVYKSGLLSLFGALKPILANILDPSMFRMLYDLGTMGGEVPTSAKNC